MAFSSEGSVKVSQLTVVSGPTQSGPQTLVYFQSVANRKKTSLAGTEGWFLGVRNGQLVANGGVSEATSHFSLQVLQAQAEFQPLTTSSKAGRPKSLSASQKLQFYQAGYLQIRSVVPLELLNRALKLVNHEMGTPGSLVPSGDETGMAKLAGNVSNAQDIKDLLLRSDAWGYVASLMGEDRCESPLGAQIALRFPEFGNLEELPGHDWHTDGMRQAKRNPFSLLVGITLSDTVEPLSGNFTVFPGTHHTIHNMLKADQGSIPLNSGDNRQRANEDKSLDFGQPTQLTSLRGDLVIAHPHLAHRVAPNYSPSGRSSSSFCLRTSP